MTSSGSDAPCVNAALAELQAAQAERNIALVHHPLEWLQAALEASAHVLLRGHLREARIASIASAEGAFTVLRGRRCLPDAKVAEPGALGDIPG